MRDLTEAFYVIVSPEWTTKCHVIKQDAIDQPKEPGSTHTDLLAHDLGIAKQVADSNIIIMGHKSQEVAFSHTHTKTQIDTSGSSKRQRREHGS